MAPLVKKLFLLIFPTLLGHLSAQTVTCGTLSAGCNGGKSHDLTLKAAIARFESNKIYGGRSSPVVFASSSEGANDLAQISFSCTDGSIPPAVAGSSAQSYLGGIVSCANQCGSVTLPQNSNCGFGVVIADDAMDLNCFYKAINVVPTGVAPVAKSFQGTFNSLGCWSDAWDARTLTGGSSTQADMTLAKCVALAAGFKYAGVEYSTECYWGNTIAATASGKAPTDCDMSCGGSIFDACGGGNRMNLYENSAHASTTVPPTATPTPTLKPSVGSFKNPGCFVDSSNARVLADGSSSDWSSTGMTIEKCVELAGGWRYAGLEYSGECFWGDIQVNPQSANLADCDMACSGDLSELCGGGNRVLIYQDENWTNPTRPALAAAIEEYEGVMVDLQVAIKLWNDLLLLYEAESSGGTKVRRDLADLLFRICEARLAILALRPHYELVAIQVGRMFRTAARYEKLYDEEMAKKDDLFMSLAENLRRIASDSAKDVTAATFSIAHVAFAVFGVRVVQGAILVTGLFKFTSWLIESLMGRLGSGGGGGDPDPTPTDTPTSTSTTSTCTMTATTTPVIIVTYKDTTITQFNEMVASLPKDGTEIVNTEPWNPYWFYVVKIDQCTSEKLLFDNPIVQGISIDADIEVEGTTTTTSTKKRSKTAKKSIVNSDGESLETEKRRKKRKAKAERELKQRSKDYTQSEAAKKRRQQRSNGIENLERKAAIIEQEIVETVNNTLKGRSIPTANSNFKMQDPAPGHLSWLTQISRFTRWTGSYLNFPSYIWNDVTVGEQSIVYIIDTDFHLDHEAFRSKLIDSWQPTNDGKAKLSIIDAGVNHGTCMASLAVGDYHSVGKQSHLVAIQLDSYIRGMTTETRSSRAIGALLSIHLDVRTRRAQGRAIVSMSWAVERERLWWKDPLDATVSKREWTVNVFDLYLQILFDEGIVVVCSAGNDPMEDLTEKIPRGQGGATSPLIVVGNAQYDNTKHLTSTYRDDKERKGILSLYNVGTDVDCARLAEVEHEEGGMVALPHSVDPGTTWGVEPPGSSQATAITAGMIAYLLADTSLTATFDAAGDLANFAFRVKVYLRNMSRDLKGDAGRGDGVPTAAMKDLIPCVGGTVGRPPIPNVDNPTGTTSRPFIPRDVTNGINIVFNPLPQCWNLT